MKRRIFFSFGAFMTGIVFFAAYQTFASFYDVKNLDRIDEATFAGRIVREAVFSYSWVYNYGADTKKMDMVLKSIKDINDSRILYDTLSFVAEKYTGQRTQKLFVKHLDSSEYFIEGQQTGAGATIAQRCKMTGFSCALLSNSSFVPGMEYYVKMPTDTPFYVNFCSQENYSFIAGKGCMKTYDFWAQGTGLVRVLDDNGNAIPITQRMYVCNPGMHYNPVQNKCLIDNSECTANNGVKDPQTGICTKIADQWTQMSECNVNAPFDPAHPCIVNNVSQIPDSTTGMYTHTTPLDERSCTTGTHYNPAKNQCLADNSECTSNGGIWANGVCAKITDQWTHMQECNVGITTFDPTHPCIVDSVSQTPDPISGVYVSTVPEAARSCTTGTHYNSTTKLCVIDGADCANGDTYNASTKLCTKIVNVQMTGPYSCDTDNTIGRQHVSFVYPAHVRSSDFTVSGNYALGFISTGNRSGGAMYDWKGNHCKIENSNTASYGKFVCNTDVNEPPFTNSVSRPHAADTVYLSLRAMCGTKAAVTTSTATATNPISPAIDYGLGEKSATLTIQYAEVAQ